MENRRDQPAYRQLMDQYMNAERAAIVPRAVQLHIVTRDDGTGGIPVADVRDEFTNWVNPYFAGVNTSFFECAPVQYINSTAYYSLSGDAEGDAMAVANNSPNVVNIYFVDDPDGACGWARFPWDLPNDYVVIANTCATNKSTLVHELGHYFSLYHTHETAFGAESVTRNSADGCYDCPTDGDKLCDTPADPTLNDAAVTITAAPACVYSSALTDGCSVAYTPDATQIMSYSLKACRTVFSTEQKAKMTLTLASAPGAPLYGRNYILTSCCDGPEAICRNVTVTLTDAGTASITAAQVNNGSKTECGFGSLSVTPNSFNCSNLGTNTVTLTVTDALGATSTCTATVTIVDDTAPVITNPASNMTVQCASSGNAAAFASWLANKGGATASDACGGSWSNNSTGLSNGCGNTGSEAVTFTYADGSGNSASTTATFAIVDNTPPTVTCPANIHLPECVATASWSVVASDVCGSVTVVSTPPSGSGFAKGSTTTVNVVATDECGNSSSCSFTVTRDPDLQVAIDPLSTSALNTCALGTGANIILGYGGGPICTGLHAVATGGHGPYTYAWTKPATVPAAKFTNANTASPTFCANFQTAPCVTYTFVVTATDVHGCTETADVSVNVVRVSCSTHVPPNVSVCHRPVGNEPGQVTICIGSTGVAAHLTLHNDCLGGCDATCISLSARAPIAASEQGTLDEQALSINVLPNPFSSVATIAIASMADERVELSVVDLSGRVVASLYNGMLAKDVAMSVQFDAQELPPGTYIARLIGAQGHMKYTTMVLVK